MHASVEFPKEQISVDQAPGQLSASSQVIEITKDQIQQARRLIVKFSDHPDDKFSTSENGKL